MTPLAPVGDKNVPRALGTKMFIELAALLTRKGNVKLAALARNTFVSGSERRKKVT